MQLWGINVCFGAIIRSKCIWLCFSSCVWLECHSWWLELSSSLLFVWAERLWISASLSEVDEVIARLAPMLPTDIPDRSIVMFKIVNLDKSQTVVYQKQKGKGFWTISWTNGNDNNPQGFFSLWVSFFSLSLKIKISRARARARMISFVGFFFFFISKNKNFSRARTRGWRSSSRYIYYTILYFVG